MRQIIQKFDRALKALYNLPAPHRAENFLIVPSSPKLKNIEKVKQNSDQGAVIVKYLKGASTVDLGIFFGDKIRAGLHQAESLEPAHWQQHQLHALSVAAEEISHFHYLIDRCQLDRQVTQLELELQGEIDKFLLLFFLIQQLTEEDTKLFEVLFEKVFFDFSWSPHLTLDQKARYEEANTHARQFIKNFGETIWTKRTLEEALSHLRHFYRLSQSEKLGFIAGLL